MTPEELRKNRGVYTGEARRDTYAVLAEIQEQAIRVSVIDRDWRKAMGLSARLSELCGEMKVMLDYEFAKVAELDRDIRAALDGLEED